MIDTIFITIMVYLCSWMALLYFQDGYLPDNARGELYMLLSPLVLFIAISFTSTRDFLNCASRWFDGFSEKTADVLHKVLVKQ